MHVKKRQIPAALNEAISLYQKGAFTHAATLLKAVIKADARNAEALHLLGLLEGQQGHFDDALTLLKRAITADATIADYYNSLGVVLRKLGRMKEAEKAYSRCLDIDRHHLEAHGNMGTLMRHLKRYEEAIRYCQFVTTQQPDNPKALANLAGALCELGELSKAKKFFHRALEKRPSKALAIEILASLSGIAWTEGDAEESSSCRLKILEDFDSHYQVSNYLLTLNYLHTLDGKSLATEYHRFADRFSADINAPCDLKFTKDPNHSPLRIGYVSHDLVDHPVGWLLEPVLNFHNRQDFFVIAYDIHTGKHDARPELMNSVDRWHDCRDMDMQTTSELIQLDRVDILVDLAGHTGLNELFRQKLAPIQVNWLGYFHTTCFASMDWLLADPISILPDEDSYYIENIWRLPFFRFCYKAPDFATDVLPSPHLLSGHITFGSFNNLIKINDLVLDTWSSILRQAPESRLLLRWPSLTLQDVKNRIIQKFSERGIQAERLILKDGLPHEELFTAYGEVDIALDTFPFSGGMTSLEALWMGVPVVTIAGDRVAGRQTQAFLSLSGHSELIAFSIQEYIAIAVTLSNSPGKLAHLREQLRGDLASSPVCNHKQFTNDLENAFKGMWTKWCQQSH